MGTIGARSCSATWNHGSGSDNEDAKSSYQNFRRHFVSHRLQSILSTAEIEKPSRRASLRPVQGGEFDLKEAITSNSAKLTLHCGCPFFSRSSDHDSKFSCKRSVLDLCYSRQVSASPPLSLITAPTITHLRSNLGTNLLEAYASPRASHHLSPILVSSVVPEWTDHD